MPGHFSRAHYILVGWCEKAVLVEPTRDDDELNYSYRHKKGRNRVKSREWQIVATEFNHAVSGAETKNRSISGNNDQSGAVSKS